MTTVTAPWRKERPQSVQWIGDAGGLWLFSEAKGLDVGNDLPTI